MEEMDDGLISFKWNNHKNTFFYVLASLRSKETYTDATLACEGKFFPVHKLVMSTCSDYFAEVFEKAGCKSPVVILKDIRQQDLEALLDYMYLGEVDVKQTELSELLHAAECLRIKGLAVPDYFTFSTPTKSYIGIPQTNETPQTHLEEKDSVASPESSDLSPPAKKSKSDQLQFKGTEQSKNLNINSLINDDNFDIPHLSLPSNMPFSFDSLDFDSPPKLNKEISPPKTPNSPTIVNSEKSPFDPSQEKADNVKTPETSTFTPVMKLVNNATGKKLGRPRKNVKLDSSSSSTLPHNHKDFYFKHKETSHQTSEKVVQKKRKRAAANIKIDSASTSILLSANLENIKEKQEPIITPEDFCNRIGLPEFSSNLIPILEGHQVTSNDRHAMANTIIETLISHFRNNHMHAFMCNRHLRGKFFNEMQRKIVEKYPNNILEDLKSQRKGTKGPLGKTMAKVADRMNRRMRSQGTKERVLPPSPLRPATSQTKNKRLWLRPKNIPINVASQVSVKQKLQKHLKKSQAVDQSQGKSESKQVDKEKVQTQNEDQEEGGKKKPHDGEEQIEECGSQTEKEESERHLAAGEGSTSPLSKEELSLQVDMDVVPKRSSPTNVEKKDADE